jgi:hypothetical protein
VASIVILEHELQRYVELPYMAYSLAERWRRAGHDVKAHRGTQDPPPGDLAIVNIDLTVIPPDYQALFARYPRVVNGRVTDVSKSRFSVDLLDRYSDWIGPVIVKTEANYGGKPEYLLRSVAQRRGLRCDIPQGPVAEGYPIYTSLREVPPAVWDTSGVVVERFLPEMEDGLYCCRHWVFFGDRDRSIRVRARVPIVKSHDIVDSGMVPVPDELREMRSRLGFDFGKFDYVRHRERWVLIDANRSPSMPAQVTPQVTAGQDHLAQGLGGFLGPGAQVQARE